MSVVIMIRSHLYKQNNIPIKRLINKLGYSTSFSHARKDNPYPKLLVSPKIDLYDQQLRIQVEGLEPHKAVTLKAEMREDHGKLLHSNAHYVADQNGFIDISVSASQSGSYKGVFPGGLLTCLKIATGNFEFGRIHKKDMKAPIKIQISVLDGHKQIDEVEPVLDSVEVERCFMAEGVRRIPVKEGNIRGVLYLPKGEGPFPGIIGMFGASGALYEGRAALNASRGIADLALAYFSYEDIPWQRIHNLDLEYFEEAVEFLRSLPEVQSEKCGVLGNCFGGFLAYMMGVYLERVKAVYIINSSFNPYIGTLKHRGRTLSECDYDDFDVYLDRDSNGHFSTSKRYNEAINNVTPSLMRDFNNLPDDKYFKVAAGEGDTYESHIGWKRFQEGLTIESEKRFELEIYPKAGHLVYPPNSPFASTILGKFWGRTPDHQKGMLFKFGGDAQSNYNMQKGVMKDWTQFFRSHLTTCNG